MKVFRTVQFRLTLWYAVLLTFLLSFFGFFMHTEFERLLYRDVDLYLVGEATALESSLGRFLGHLPQPPRSEDPDSVRFMQKTLLEWEAAHHQVRKTPLMVRLIKSDHTSLMGNLTRWQKEIIFPDFERDSIFMEKGESFQIIHFQKKPFRLFYKRLDYPDFPDMILQVGTSLAEANGALDRLTFIIWITIPAAALASCVVGLFLIRRSLEPVDLMIREARNITAAYLKSRLPRTQTGDEIDRLAETLNEMMDRIESSTRTVQDFSSNVSHEFKTPLAIIRGEIDLALRRARSPEALTETLRVIEGEVNELIRLVDDLMLLLRSDSKQLRYEKKKLSMSALLSQVAERFLDRAEKKKIRLSMEFRQEADVEGDDVYLKRLFSNLLDNAIKFTPEGGEISLSLSRRDGKALVEVRDTGIGIEPEMQSRVFTRFYRADQARSYEGSGLGLNIAKTIADIHQGTIELHSVPGKGTTLRVFLPVVS